MSNNKPLDPLPYYIAEDGSRRSVEEIRRSANEGESGGIVYNLAVWKPRAGWERDKSRYVGAL